MTISKYGLTSELSGIAKKIAWANIVIQFAFPITASLPANVFAKQNSQEKQFISTNVLRNTYQVKGGDTPDSIAKNFNIKLSQLIEENPDYVSLSGKLKIKEGIKLNIPKEKKQIKKWLNNREVDIPDASSDGKALAQLIADNSSLLNKEADLSQYAISRVTSKANSEIEQWLNQFGHARVSLSTDKKFTLEGSSADLLIPLYDHEKNLVFSQTSYHRKDSRSQLNQGIGYRHFTDKFMLGLNAFYDYDLSRYHSRFGIGAEVWRDYFKLSVNHYHRLSNWRTSDDVMDYNERPANGWDIRTEGYLPIYPQLGAKLIFEQYYGKEVGLFGKDNRQENPHAYTFGINYTPIPLVTFSAERKMGLHDHADNKLDLSLSYRIGESIAKQIDPDNVKAMHTLAGSRYDFVDRNNDIVLEYQKKILVFISMNPEINGYAKEERDLAVNVHSKYPLKQIVWSDNGLIDNGGKINHNGGFNYSVVLPNHIAGSLSKNTYTISAVAIDEQGNRSDPVESKIIVDQAAINTNNSLFEPKVSQLPADGHTKQHLTLSVFDNDKLPVDININELKLEQQSDTTKGNSQISPFSRIDKGQYQLTVTAGSTPEKLTLTPVFRDNSFNSATLILIADNITAEIAKGDLSVIKDNAPANGKSENKIQVIVSDINHNPLPNYSVTFTADNSAKIISQDKTDSQGKIIVPITNTLSGISHIGVKVRDIIYPIDVNFIADNNTAHIPQQSLVITPAISLADNKTEKTVSLQVIDKQNNPVPDMQVNLSVDKQAQLKEKLLTTDKEGKASTSLISKFAGTMTVSAKVNNYVTQATTEFTANQANGQIISITPSAPPYIADGQTKVIFTAVVKDNFGNPLPHAQIGWETNRDKNVVKIDEMTITDINGVTTTTLTSTQAMNVIVTARINNQSLEASPINFIANNQKGLITELNIDKTQIVANNTEQAKLTAVVKDKFGNKLSNVVVHWQGSAGTQFTQVQSTTDNQGLARNSVSTSQSGITTITAKLDNGEQAQNTLTAVADPQSGSITLSTLNNKITAIADNQDTITVIATLTDSHQNLLKNTPVYWQSSLNTLSNTITQTDDKGKTQVVISGNKALATTVSASLLNKQQKSIHLDFIAGAAVSTNSQFSVEPQSIIADGKSVAVGKIILRDKFNNPVKGRSQSVTLKGDNNTIKFTQVQEITEGSYQTNITGTQEGLSQITANIDTITSTQPLGFLADKQTATIQSVTVISPYSVTANGNDKVTIKAQIADKQGNTNIRDVTVGWITDLGKLSAPLSKTNSNGIAEITVSSRQAGLAHITAMLDSHTAVDADHVITFVEGNISASLSTLAIFPNVIVAETGRANVTLTLKDDEGNPLSGFNNKITLTATPSLQNTITSFKEGQKGVYHAQISALKTGTMSLSARVDNVDIKQTTSLTVIPNSPSAKVKNFTISDTHPHAGDTITYTAYLIDNHDNPVGKGVPVTWSTNEGSQLQKPLTLTDDNGIATVNLYRGPAGIAKVSATLISGTYDADDVSFVADNVDENKSELTLLPAKIIADGKDSAVLSLLIKDKGGNILPSQTVQAISNEPTIVFSPAKQVSPGLYEIKVTGTKAGNAELGVKVNGIEFKKHKTLQLNADTSTWKIQAVSVDKKSMIAGDTKGVIYQASVVDANNNILPNVIVSWKLTGLADDYNFSTYTDKQGIARTTVTSKVAGILKMSAYLDLTNHKAIDDVTVLPANIDTTKSTFSSSRSSIGGDDKDSTTLTVKLVDQYNNTISNKDVTLKSTSGTPHFAQNPIKSIGNGEYQTTMTSNIKTDIVLTAEADGITIAKPITIKVTIPKPNIVFDKQIQQKIYASAPVPALSYSGLPTNLDVMWSSSDTSIASINVHSGQISMKKAGTVIITLQTSGDEHYQPAQNSYPLVIDKADIGLSTPITQFSATWKDNVQREISLLLSNVDSVANPPSIQFINYDKNIIDIDNKGKITPIKPGHTAITAISQATEQFKSSSITIDYKQEKGVLDYQFNDPDITLFTQPNASVDIPAQQTKKPVPVEANAKWSSDNTNIVQITPEGRITKLNVDNGAIQSTAILTLSVVGNDFYQDYSQNYKVIVKPIPDITISKVNFREMQQVNSSMDVNQLEWHPLYNDDNKIVIDWNAKDQPYAVDFIVLANDGTTLEKQSVLRYMGAPIAPVTLTIQDMHKIKAHDALILQITVFDDQNKPYIKNYKIKVTPPTAKDINTVLNVNYTSSFLYTNTGAKASSCQDAISTSTTHLIINPIIEFKNRVDQLRYPIKVKAGIYDVTMDPTPLSSGNINSDFTYPGNPEFNQTSSSKIKFEETSSNYAIDKECRISDSGTANLKMTFEIEGTYDSISVPFIWGGNSNAHSK
ncbi:Ig-like domain-containing protein [Proteus myxofaciens]|uniref:Invasin n=1 Tax=Proteus myxofaciens ATCC 19692 TaxID=1354337 RepID=A0A198FLS5_9GAMM|nr:Ig-like domain-containing protein [Proteus myxofaciens]OAT25897.1 hypothetical protein M983_2256 [Proteus myxofaciens ATCC 19692]